MEKKAQLGILQWYGQAAPWVRRSPLAETWQVWLHTDPITHSTVVCQLMRSETFPGSALIKT